MIASDPNQPEAYSLKPTASLPGPLGFSAGGVTAGIKPSGAPDLGAILCDRPAVTAALTTTNLFQGAPVQLTRRRLARSPFCRGVLVNSGISNACTGAKGLRDAEAMARAAERAAGLKAGDFLVASTGVIGVPLPLDKINAAVPGLFASLSPTGWDDFARAIMTTDTVPKLARRFVDLPGGPRVTILGVAKGSGMIHPNMATMLAWLLTDYPLAPARARSMLRRVADRTFNCLSVDGDTSTSDTVVLMANGATLDRRAATPALDRRFEAALLETAGELTRMLARDGEGATRLVTIEVAGASSDAGARRVAASVARSCLVKTAIFGHDPNFGRICCAAGYAGVRFDVNEFQLKLQGCPVMKRGVPVPFDRAALSQALDQRDVLVQIQLGSGRGAARYFTCDLTYDYIRVNASYTT